MLDKYGRHDWTRTSDLFRVKSPSGLIRKRAERHEATQRGSVHAGFRHVRCLLCVPVPCRGARLDEMLEVAGLIPHDQPVGPLG